MKGNGRLALMIGALLMLGSVAPSRAAVGSGNNAAAPATLAATEAQSDQLAASDQLSDTDRSMREQTSPAQPAPTADASASNDAPPQRTVAQAGNQHSLWDETSLIGKVFIAFGTLLTIASAARMFMA